ncbi:MAG TPA: LLM class flavin-dependent oxidoreductase [Actinomycetota bacterium]|nr:LLM class flavin-dependent oxidoreductase [Actinomycetota bacterium]
MARPLRVGIQLPEVEHVVRWPEIVSIARAAEESGFDSVWAGDHLLYRGDGRPERGPWDVWSTLAGLAAVTRRVTLGPLVACLAFHPPGVLARMAAAVDEISGGRFVLGVGAGWNRAEFEAFGLPYDRRVERFAEAFTVVTALLRGDRVTLDGRFTRVRDAVLLPPPERRVPVVIGSTGERVLGLALPHVDAWNTWYDLYGNTPEGFERDNATVSAVARRVGRDPAEIERSACVFVAIDRFAGGRPITEDAPPVEGPPAAIASHLRDLADAGADEAILVVKPPTEESVRALGGVLARLDRG